MGVHFTGVFGVLAVSTVAVTSSHSEYLNYVGDYSDKSLSNYLPEYLIERLRRT